MQLGVGQDQSSQYNKQFIKQWIQEVNEVVSRKDIINQVTDFNLELQEAEGQSRIDQVVLRSNNK